MAREGLDYVMAYRIYSMSTESFRTVYFCASNAGLVSYAIRACEDTEHRLSELNARECVWTQPDVRDRVGNILKFWVKGFQKIFQKLILKTDLKKGFLVFKKGMAPIRRGESSSGESPDDAFLCSVIVGQISQGLPTATPRDMTQPRRDPAHGPDPGAAFRSRMRHVGPSSRLTRREFCYGCGHGGHSLCECPTLTRGAEQNPYLTALGRVEAGYIQSGGQIMCTHCTQVGHARAQCPMLGVGRDDQQVLLQRGPESPIMDREQGQANPDP
ncbi:hypothetical protein LXL04_013522 [Taraxacum kok-saghyz]